MTERLKTWAQRNGLLFALLILIAIFSLMSGRFFTVANFTVILLQDAVIGIVAVPVAMLTLAGFIDLSVGSVAVLSAVVFGEAMSAGLGLPVSLVIGLGVGAGWGALNGYLIAALGLSPIVVTLGGLAGARGLAQFITEGFTTYGYGPTFAFLGNGKLFGVPVPVVLFLLVFIVGLHIWYRAPAGRHMVAIGGARETAAEMGIAVKALPFWLYIGSGLAAAVGGLIFASQLDGAAITIGTGMELDVLTAVLLGGVSFTGGRGSLWGVLFGLLFVGVLANGLVQVNVNPYFQQVAIGLALGGAAGLDKLYQHLERLKVPVEADPALAAAAPAEGGAE
jgi:ribose transport system permease protein